MSDKELRPCPKCGANMLLRRTGMVLDSYPPQYPLEWRCGCGHREAGGRERGKTEEERFVEDWHAANPAAAPSAAPGVEER